MTNWFAQAEHGGFYQAKATGLYEKAGLDVTIKMGGPQVNGMQLHGRPARPTSSMGYDIQVLQAPRERLPVVDGRGVVPVRPAGLMAHDDVQELARPEGQADPDRRGARDHASGRG